MSLFKIEEQIIIPAPKSRILEYFQRVQAQPRSYSFDSHQGVIVIEGTLDRPGSIFQTTEKFFVFDITLLFRVVEVDPERQFVFQVIKPFSAMGIHGFFRYESINQGTTELRLAAYSPGDNILSRLMSSDLFLSPARIFVRKQLQKELAFIKHQIVSAH